MTGAYWYTIGVRARDLGWAWAPGMWALDGAEAALRDAYEVAELGGELVGRRVSDGLTCPVRELVPYLNDEGVTAACLLARVRELRGDPAFDVWRDGSGWGWGLAQVYATRMEALVAAGE